MLFITIASNFLNYAQKTVLFNHVMQTMTVFTLRLPVEEKRKKGVIRKKLKIRGFRPPLPSIILANVRLIRNKVDEISAHVRYNNVFRESCIMCFTETWLDTDDNDNFTTIDGFSCVRSDRTAESNKKKGGGLCVYINNKFCNNYTV